MQLTVPNEAMEIEYAVTTASTGPFVVPFGFYNLDDVKVYSVDSDGVATELVRVTDWTWSSTTATDDGYSGGEITLNSSVSNVTIKIYRDSIIDRTTNFPITGSFSIALLNEELNRFVHIMQELAQQKANYISLPESAVAATPWDLADRAAGNAGESAADDALATNRQVDASGPNWLADDDAETQVGTQDQWQTIYSAAGIVIEGNDTTKLFDLLTEFFCFIQNRGGAEASFYVRYRYQVDCYAQVTKIANSAYPIKVAATSAIPFSFMDIAQDIDYSNGNCTVSIGIDIYPQGASSADLWLQWGNLAVNTSEPR